MPVTFNTLEEINKMNADAPVSKFDLADEIIKQDPLLDGDYDVALPQAPYNWVKTVAEKLQVEERVVLVSFVWYYPKDGFGHGHPMPINTTGIHLLMRLGAWA